MRPSSVKTQNPMDNLARLKVLYQAIQPLLQEVKKEETIKQIALLFSRAASDSVTIMVCGEFKRGKSSIVNAIIGEEICPVDDCITTSSVSLIKYGATPRVVRHFLNADNNVVTESINIDSIEKFSKGSSVNTDNTILLEIEIPNEKLKSGLTILDTPGIGGLDPRHLSLTTFALTKADCVFFVADAQEPISASELSFIKDKISPFGTNTNIILNKIDLLSEAQIRSLVKDTQSKVKAVCQAISIDVIPTSIYQWQLYVLTKDETYLSASNIKSLEKGIADARMIFKTNLLPVIKKSIQTAASEVKAVYNEQLSAISDPNPEMIAKFQEQGREIANAKRELEQPNSKFNRDLSAILEDAQNAVMTKLSTESIILSSSKLDELLNCDCAKSSNGMKYVTEELNKSLQSLSGQLDSIIDDAFEQALDKAQISFEVSREEYGSLLPSNLRLREKETSEKLFLAARNSMSGLGVFSATTLIGGLVASSAVIMPIAALGGVYMAYKSIVNANHANNKAEIRQQVQPRLTIALNELKTYVQNRFKEFSQALKEGLLGKVAEMEAEMMSIRVQMEECNANMQKIAHHKTELQKKIAFVDTTINQLNVLLNNPFAKSQSV